MLNTCVMAKSKTDFLQSPLAAMLSFATEEIALRYALPSRGSIFQTDQLTIAIEPVKRSVVS